MKQSELASERFRWNWTVGGNGFSRYRERVSGRYPVKQRLLWTNQSGNAVKIIVSSCSNAWGDFFSLKYRINAGSEAYYGFISHEFRLQKKKDPQVPIFRILRIFFTSCRNCSVPSQLRAKIHSKSAVPIGFLPSISKFSYGQRSKCTDLLNSYFMS